ncbi:efflux RND transporter periplasmic adaptor subunit [Paraferrimonas sp. SM1919]|uniref:efflux RND transporter periplasmic adaptor subunit n=1 Tax=Paraferrimonas sp. SM1919 TaxID=2662263 RepID=UPI0013D5680D|nr:efflux RND transporter periplasmic adaptor subunit [Paraferrimonas sp. SM1919]
MKKWVLFMILLAAALFGSVGYYNFVVISGKIEAFKNRPEPNFPVTTIITRHQDWQPSINAIGFIEPNQGVMLATEAAGRISKINFINGTAVSQGDALIELNSKVEQANLKAAQVRVPAAKADYQRMQRLYKNNSVSKADLDTADANYQKLLAEIESLKATIDRRQIRAPFSGLIGIREVNLGQYVNVGTNVVQLEDISTMKLRFTVPQTELSKISVGTPIMVQVEAFKNEIFSGQIAAIEPAVFAQSGLIQVQAAIPNQQQKLRSGMFAKVAIMLPKLENQIVLPQTAINFTLYGTSVFTVDSDSRVEEINVKVLEREGNHAHVTGIDAGVTVVTSGQIRLSNGALVKEVEDKALTATEMPKL